MVVNEIQFKFGEPCVGSGGLGDGKEICGLRNKYLFSLWFEVGQAIRNLACGDW